MKRIFSSILIFFFLIFSLHANLITSEKFSYTLDMPEGFEISDMEQDETSVIFKNKYLDVSVLIKVWPNSKFSDSMTALKDTLTRLKANSEYSQAMWRRQKCTIASFDSPSLLEGIAKGWACSIPLPQKKGFLTILTYVPQKLEADLQQVLISILDSVMIDTGSYREPGLITSTFYPRKQSKKINLEVSGKNISTTIDSIDAEANQFVIDREFSIFTFYAKNQLPETYDAWLRFYRVLARDTMERVKKPAFDIYSAMRTEAEKSDKQNPSAALAQLLLTWSQNFNYERKSVTADKADIESIPAILEGGSSDCDGRSLLLMCLLKHCGIDSCMFISAEYSHALLGVCFPDKQGQTISVDTETGKKEYLVGETTAKDVTLGMIPASMTDKSKWMAVELP
ncbi:MAG: hypothetical protein KBT11_05515 [Treponema sp.]|nr:hypothetical protein [Candidatus Treponema equifaecale]